MTPAVKSFTVTDRVNGLPRVRIIDATLDVKIAEYAMTRAFAAQLISMGIAVERTAFPKTPQEFLDEFGAAGEFNILVLVAHGQVKKDPDSPDAVHVRLAGLRAPWLLLAQASAKLDDKLVMLAVCGGHCDDTIFTFIRDAHLALLLFASVRKVNTAEVGRVFPAVLKELHEEASSTGSFSGEKLEAARQRHDTTNAFKVYSGVGILP